MKAEKGLVGSRLTGILVLALVLWALGAGWGRARESKGSIESGLLQGDAPLHVASDRMEADQKARKIVFWGHVVVRQKDMTITGDRLTVFAAEDAGESLTMMMDRIERIEVEGNVRISQEDKIAAADRAVYYHGEQKIVLSGNPRVSQGKDTVRGSVITLFLEEERSVVEGSGESPVQVVIHPSRDR